MLKRALCLSVFAVILAVFASGMTVGGEKKGKGKDDPKYNNPTFVPTADEVIHKMFQMAKVNKNDVIFDLGCGDNRICFMAAKKFGSRGVGIETNPVRIREAMDMFDKYNKNDAISYGTSVKLPLVETRHGDALAMKDIGDATVVVMYMFPEFMTLWFPIAEKHLKPGTRILSHDYEWNYDTLPNAWRPVATATVKSSSRDNHKVIMWVVPPRKSRSK
ncbi:MAG: class I SAM-dependent methyltransferase [Planctomycetes bacterium]|nr:class I SAM-dependent methyltransferase [Planctomycetota bacterium]